jgi:hypothetical protein
MSIVIADVMASMGLTAQDALQGHEGYSLASITAGLARSCQQGVARDEEGGPAHGVVFGDKPRPIRKRLAEESEWVVPPA